MLRDTEKTKPEGSQTSLLGFLKRAPAAEQRKQCDRGGHRSPEGHLTCLWERAGKHATSKEPHLGLDLSCAVIIYSINI